MNKNNFSKKQLVYKKDGHKQSKNTANWLDFLVLIKDNNQQALTDFVNNSIDNKKFDWFSDFTEMDNPLLPNRIQKGFKQLLNSKHIIQKEKIIPFNILIYLNKTESINKIINSTNFKLEKLMEKWNNLKYKLILSSIIHYDNNEMLDIFLNKIPENKKEKFLNDFLITFTDLKLINQNIYPHSCLNYILNQANKNKLQYFDPYKNQKFEIIQKMIKEKDYKTFEKTINVINLQQKSTWSFWVNLGLQLNNQEDVELMTTLHHWNKYIESYKSDYLPLIVHIFGKDALKLSSPYKYNYWIEILKNTDIHQDFSQYNKDYGIYLETNTEEVQILLESNIRFNQTNVDYLMESHREGKVMENSKKLIECLHIIQEYQPEAIPLFNFNSILSYVIDSEKHLIPEIEKIALETSQQNKIQIKRKML